MVQHMLTTVDNPYSPVTHYNEWLAWDMSAGYHSIALLARVLVTSDELSEPDRASAEEAAIDEVCRENVSGVHRKVVVPEI